MREENMARYIVANQPPCLVEGWETKYVAVVIAEKRVGTKLLRMLVTMAQSEHNECLITLITDKGSKYKSIKYPLLNTCVTTLPILNDLDSIRMYVKEHMLEIGQIFLCVKDSGLRKSVEEMIGSETSIRPITINSVLEKQKSHNGLLDGCEEGIIERLGIETFYDYADSHDSKGLWEEADAFEKDANYNSAMHLITKLYLTGLRIRKELRGPEEAIKSEQEFLGLLDEDSIERLERLEHLRWCAFHLVYGYKTLPRREAKILLHDRKNRRHGCLVPWEELSALSVCCETDFKKEDRDRVEHIFRYVKRSGHVLIKAKP